ncbi:hypothetical protein AbraIFM66951_007541 [Aspergillus brasiliensis]|uniref:SMP-30/Gluconolactonase/LRE-like region domain-containing protein n=1 Tax=Aspergillus brasiliensis TaxID=319629 RepID=A0A9W5YG31_9EURO|nr:hypothetical protein AbraCBS73388_008243 [Aspergillus brasiliensis]GKZ40988.1 hypothetical protein AbraIFM66951_007541 [Aspergillus brasiliensis]
MAACLQTHQGLRPVELVSYPRKADFHPLGVNIFRGASNDRTRLFVVNHGRSGSTVEIMDIDYTEARATHILTVADGDINIRTPNAVAPISYTQFYVTNDHYYPLKSSPLMSHLETWLSLRKGWVTLVDLSNPEIIDCKVVAKGIAFANGITLTPTGKQLLVASTSTNCVHIYDRDPTNNALSGNCEMVRVSFPPDNLRFDFSLSVDDPTAFDQDGRFLRGATASGCPNPLKLVGMSKNPAAVKAPSMIVELCKGKNSNTASHVATLSGPETKYCARARYQSSGQHFPCATTGAVDLSRGRLIGSGLYAEGILDISFEAE